MQVAGNTYTAISSGVDGLHPRHGERRYSGRESSAEQQCGTHVGARSPWEDPHVN